MLGQSIKDRYEKVSPYLNNSGLDAKKIAEIEWLASIILTPNPNIDRKKIIQKCHEFQDLGLAGTLSTAINDRTVVTSLFQKFEELLSSLEESVDTNNPSNTTETISTGILREAHPYKSLWFYNGIRVSSLPQLYSSLKDIDDETFRGHVNEYKHDIAEWVKESLHDEILSKRLSEGKTREDIQSIIEHAMHEKIHSTLKESEEIQNNNDNSVNSNKLEDEIKILDALELPELPGDIKKILGVKEDKNAEKIEKEVKDKKVQEKEAQEKKAKEEEIRRQKEEAEIKLRESSDKKEKTKKDSVEDIIPIQKQSRESEDENFSDFMELFEETNAKIVSKEVSLDQEPEEKYVPKAHTTATALFVSKKDENENNSIERYDKIENKLKVREKELSLMEKEIENTSNRMKTLNNHEEEFDLQEQLSSKKKEIIRIKDDIQSIRKTLSEMHKTPAIFKRNESEDTIHTIRKEEMLSLIHDAVTAEHKIELKSVNMHPVVNTTINEKQSSFREKEEYNPKEEQQKISNEIKRMQSENNDVVIEEKTVMETKKEDDSLLKQKSLSEIHNDEVFFCKNGSVIKSLIQLYNITNEMDQDSFNHHVNHDKNDFAVWIEYSLGLPELSLEIRKTKTKNGMKKAIEKWFIKLGIEENIGIKDEKILIKKQEEKEIEKSKLAQTSKTIIQKQKESIAAKPLPKPKPKPKTSEEILENIHEHIQSDDFDNALKMIGNLRRHMKSTKKKKKDSIDDKMTEYELKALESDIKILKLKHS